MAMAVNIFAKTAVLLPVSDVVVLVVNPFVWGIGERGPIVMSADPQ
jgi:hypothetical protein